MNLKKLFLYLLIASVGISALIGIGVILIGNFGEFEQKILATTFTVTVTSILGLACGAYLETNRGKLLPVSGIFFAIIAAILWMFVIWFRGEPVEWFMKSTVTATLLAASCSHISLLSLARLERKFIWSYYAVHAVVWCLTAFLLFLIWTEPRSYEDMIGRIVGVLSILAASLTVITPVFHKLSSTEKGSAEIDSEIEGLRERINELEKQKADLSKNTESQAGPAM